MKQESNGNPKFIKKLYLEANHKVTERQIEDNLENGEEYARITKTPYQNLMLDRQVLRIEKRIAKHKFPPQEMVHHEIWTRGFQRRHNYR
jgi:hypothetical protein